MLTYLERYDLIENTQFHKRLHVALWAAAVAVINESPATANHAARLTWAKRSLKGATETIRQIAIRALADPVVGDKGMAATDAEVQSVIDSIVDDLA